MPEPHGRKSVNAHTTPFLEYDLEGPLQPEMTWLPLSFDRETQQWHAPQLVDGRRLSPGRLRVAPPLTRCKALIPPCR